MKTIYLIRHGQTDWNIHRKMQGHSDIPLNDTGKEQARSLQNFFRQNPVDRVFSSDLKRAHQTASIATQELKLAHDILTFEGLREFNLGCIEGYTEKEIVAEFGEHAWKKWTDLNPLAEDYAFPGGETREEGLVRLEKSLRHIFVQFDFKKAAVCTHGLALRRLGHYLRPDMVEPLAIPNCGVYELHWKEECLHFEGLVFNPGV